MTVKEIVNEMPLGQKWALVVCVYHPDAEPEPFEEYAEPDFHEVGKTMHCFYYDFKVDKITAQQDRIYLHVTQAV